MKKMKYTSNGCECCVICGKQTYVDVHTPVSERPCYFNGVGQLCDKCFCEVMENGI